MFDLTHAKHDPAHCLVPGLFRTLMRGERKKTKLDLTYNFGDESLRFTGFEPLDAGDMRLLQGLVAMSGPNGMVLSNEPVSDIGKQLRLFLDPKFDAVDKDARVVKSTIGHLLKETGLEDGGKNHKGLMDSLHRLSNVSVLVTQGKRQAMYHLLSYAADMEDGRIMVALNSRITEAVLGNRSHVYIPMHEVRAIKSDPTRLIHQRLCAWINPGKAGKAEIDTLCGYVWTDVSDNVNTMKTRRQTAKKALAELVSIGWTVSEYATSKYLITRPKATP